MVFLLWKDASPAVGTDAATKWWDFMTLSWRNLPCALKAAIGIGKRTLGNPRQPARHRAAARPLGLGPAPDPRLRTRSLWHDLRRAPARPLAWVYETGRGQFSKCRAVRTCGDRIFDQVPEALPCPGFVAQSAPAHSLPTWGNSQPIPLVRIAPGCSEACSARRPAQQMLRPAPPSAACAPNSNRAAW
jgi:hypothetical protein